MFEKQESPKEDSESKEGVLPNIFAPLPADLSPGKSILTVDLLLSNKKRKSKETES